MRGQSGAETARGGHAAVRVLTTRSAQPWAVPHSEHGDGPQNMECAADAGRCHVSPRCGVYPFSVESCLTRRRKNAPKEQGQRRAGKASKHRNKQNEKGCLCSSHVISRQRTACVPCAFRRATESTKAAGRGRERERLSGSVGAAGESPASLAGRGRATPSYCLPGT